ncbi:hypothetical protein [Cohaesibacter intestini]|uniref:hypothetical protein n=1 Tax=Cohaesibacter intestini TaxID=2211145 RepID=UPI000DEAEA36|nr:hypothetical protein [Cohaesibacter intestini]
MPSFFLLVRFAAWLLMAAAASLILYVFIGTDGEIWAIQALKVAKISGFEINLLAFVVIAIAKRKWLVAVNFLFLGAMLVCSFLGTFDVFWANDGRSGNQLADMTAEIGVINYVVVGSILKKERILACIALPAMFVVVTFCVYFAVAHSLKTEFAKSEAQSTCFYRIDRVEWNKIAVEPIHSLSGSKLGFFVGEHSPRIAKVQGDRALLYSYGSRYFSNSVGNDSLLRDLPFLDGLQKLSNSFGNSDLPSDLPSQLISLCNKSR